MTGPHSPIGVVAFLADFPTLGSIVAGDRVRTYEILTHLSELGVPVRVFALGDTNPPSEEPPRHRVDVRILDKRSAAVADLLRYRQMLNCLRTTAHEWASEGRQVWLYTKVPAGVMLRGGWLPVHSNPSHLLLSAAMHLGVRTWATLHDLPPDHELAVLRRKERSGIRLAPRHRAAYVRAARFAGWETARIVRRADLVTVVSNGMRDALVQRHGVSPDKVVIAPTGVNPDLVRNLPDWRPPDTGAWRLAYLGAPFDVELSTMLDAVAMLTRDGRDVQLLLASGGLPSGVAHLDDRLSVQPNVQYADFPAIAGKVDVWLNPLAADDSYFAEMGSSIKLPMYLASGRPVVMPLLPSLVREKFAALTQSAAGDDAPSLAAAVERVMDDPRAAVTRAAAARQQMLAERSWHTTAQLVLGHLLSRTVSRAPTMGPGDPGGLGFLDAPLS